MPVLQQPNEERKITVSNLYTSPKFSPSDTSLSKLLKFNHLSNPWKTLLSLTIINMLWETKQIKEGQKAQNEP